MARMRPALRAGKRRGGAPADSINRHRRGWLLYPPPEEEEG